MFAPWKGDDHAPLVGGRRTDKPRQTAAVSRAKPFPFRAAQSRVRQPRAPSIGGYIRRKSHKDRGAKWSVETGTGTNRRRPSRFVEARQKHAIKAQETRIEEAQDLKAWVSAVRRRSARRSQRVVEQGGVFVERSGEGPDRSLAPFV